VDDRLYWEEHPMKRFLAALAIAAGVAAATAVGVGVASAGGDMTHNQPAVERGGDMTHN
jgi:hypothetical protein